MGLRRSLIRLLPTSTNRLCRVAMRFADHTLGPQVIQRIEQVPGCLGREQGALLFHLAAHSSGTGRVVEIGSFMGRSTLWLAHGLRRAGHGRVFSIDPHEGRERPDIQPGVESFQAFLDNIRRQDLADFVEPVRDRSQNVARTWIEPIRLLWIDGSHRYEDVLADLEGFAGHVLVGGYVALHDTRGRRFPGVRRAMLEYFRRNDAFTRIVSLRNMTVYHRDR
jgi:hypothetical protein